MGDPAVKADESRVTRDEFHVRERAAFLAGDGDDAAPPAPKPAKKSDDADEVEDLEEDLDETSSDVDTEDDVEETSDADDADAEGDADDDESDDDLDDDDDDDEESGKDPQLKKRLEQVRRFEQRSRERLAQERASLQREIDTIKPRLERLDKFEKLSARAKYEPATVLLELGLTPDELEDAARDVYAASTKGAADPKNKDAVARSRRERELADKLASVEKKLAEREESERQAAESHANQQQAERYLRKVVKAVDGEQHPLAAAQRAKNPAKLQQRLGEVAYELAQKMGEVPSAKLVLKRYEKIRRAELEELGVDVAAVAAKTKTTAKKPGDKTTAGKNGKGDKPEPKPNGRPSRDEIVRELMSGEFD